MTFDDGYVDNLSTAMPLLRSAGVPATFFLTTGKGHFPTTTGGIGWRRWCRRTVDGRVAVARPAFRPTRASDRQRIRATCRSLARLRRDHPPSADPREAILDRIATTAGAPDLDVRDRRMTWTEVSELASDAHYTIGAHTVEHLFLPAQTDDVLMSELVESRAALERVTGSTVETLAYPFGAVDERTVRAARHAGFRLAVTCADAGSAVRRPTRPPPDRSD